MISGSWSSQDYSGYKTTAESKRKHAFPFITLYLLDRTVESRQESMRCSVKILFKCIHSILYSY